MKTVPLEWWLWVLVAAILAAATWPPHILI